MTAPAQPVQLSPVECSARARLTYDTDPGAWPSVAAFNTAARIRQEIARVKKQMGNVGDTGKPLSRRRVQLENKRKLLSAKLLLIVEDPTPAIKAHLAMSRFAFPLQRPLPGESRAKGDENRFLITVIQYLEDGYDVQL